MNKKQTFFASSNSMNGFQSYFDLIYNPNKLKKIYIVKGGPGTGKSSFIKKIGKCFEEKAKTEYFLCSSDTSSYDGLIIEDKVAIIDGTSPHSTEAKYPGAVEILIDSAKGLKKDLYKKRDDIAKLTEEKSLFYKGAYSYLNAAGTIKKEYIKSISKEVDFDKLDAAIKRFFKQNVKKGKFYIEKTRLTSGITPQGRWYTGSFENLSDVKSILVNSKGYEEIIYSRFLKECQNYSINTYVSFDPLLPYSPDGFYLPDSNLSFTTYSENIHGEVDYEKYKVFNCERFINKDSLTKNRAKLKFAIKCYNSMIDEAVNYLHEASLIHKKLEEIYKEHMDYEMINVYVEKVIEDIEISLLNA
ncbi:MAG: hypothetical protein E7582_07000 [Ruminococcaceae bacterium]|nr:hypothetical protein [Oscillospiraceae bacterium]